MATQKWVTGIRPVPTLEKFDSHIALTIWQMRCVSMREADALADALGAALVLTKIQTTTERPTEYDRRADGLWNRIEFYDRLDSEVAQYYPVFEVSDQESYDLWDQLYDWRTTHRRDTGTSAAFEFNCKIHTWPPDAEDMMEALGDEAPEWYDDQDSDLTECLNEAWGRSVEDLLGMDRESFKEDWLDSNKDWLAKVYFTGHSGGWATFVPHSAWWDSNWGLQDFARDRLKSIAAWANMDAYAYPEDEDIDQEDWWREDFWWWHTVAERLERIEAEIDSFTHNWGSLEKNSEYWIDSFTQWLTNLDEAVYDEADSPAAIRNRILTDWGRY